MRFIISRYMYVYKRNIIYVIYVYIYINTISATFRINESEVVATANTSSQIRKECDVTLLDAYERA